jgi:hypothetical protein
MRVAEIFRKRGEAPLRLPLIKSDYSYGGAMPFASSPVQERVNSTGGTV